MSGVLSNGGRHFDVQHETVEEAPRRAYDGPLERLLPDLSCDGPYPSLLGVGARQFASRSALSPVAEEFRDTGCGRCCRSLGILFSSNPLPAKARLWLSLLATATIGFFAEFRNEGKFYFKGACSFFRAWNLDSTP
jgi:hypothetical protein